MSQPSIFISYSHRDKEWLSRLQAHLGVLQQEGLVEAWSDENLHPGEHFPTEISAALKKAEIAVLLVSANFLSSTFIMQKELPVLLERMQKGELKRILPLVITPCNWQLCRDLKEMENRPKHRDSVARGNPAEQEADLADITAEVARLLSEPLPERPTPRDQKGENGNGVPPPPPHDGHYAILEVLLTHSEWDRYRVELNLNHTGGFEAPPPLTYVTSLDLPKLIHIEDTNQFAAQLSCRIFPEEPQQALVREARECARKLRVPLRLRIAIGACARELHWLRWELLDRGDLTGNGHLHESTCVLRYAGADPRLWREIRHQPKGSLNAMLVAGLTDWFEASVTPPGAADPAHEDLQHARALLVECGVEVTEIHGVLSSEALRTAIKAATPDVLYLYVNLPCEAETQEGECTGLEPWSPRLRNLPIAEALRGVETLPRLIVLTPTQPGDRSAARDSFTRWLPILREADDLAQTGVVGVLTTQAPLDAPTWHIFLKVFFSSLVQEGRMDNALFAARAAICQSDLQWTPVLISSLRTARIWYVPRFTDERMTTPTWETLLFKIKDGKCTPILGPGLNAAIARSREEIALALAETYHYPMALHERVSLPQVAQYVSSVFDEDIFYTHYKERLREYLLRRFGHLLGNEQRALPLDLLLEEVATIVLNRDSSEPHNILAELPFSTYITANLNSFLSSALRRVPGRTPQELVLGLTGSASEDRAGADPSPGQPLVYHLFGRLSDQGSSVLTEDNYFDFLIHFWKYKDLIPKVVRERLINSSLLFLGFKMHHWDFRVLMRTLLAQEGAPRRSKHMHVAVQIDPDDDQVSNPERARQYMEKYFSEFTGANINVYWGSAEDFLRQLKRRWDIFRGGSS